MCEGAFFGGAKTVLLRASWNSTPSKPLLRSAFAAPPEGAFPVGGQAWLAGLETLAGFSLMVAAAAEVASPWGRTSAG